MTSPLRLVGRTSSHYTRTARIFAAELGVDYELVLVPDLLSRDPEDYAGNPALRLPILETPEGNLYGTLNICRELARRHATRKHVVWPEALPSLLLSNAQELVLQAMAAEVTLITGRLGGATAGSLHTAKLEQTIQNVLSWLEIRLKDVLATMPRDRDLSFLEVTLFCLLRHLAFREIVSLEPYPELNTFAAEFELRPSALATPYSFQT